ncbi:MAG TPA: PadR family transcriptional regulator [Vicinamibacterales bacterium]|nr:PadR family transcriptional regulator [Vicinamibacterales bacterium]
MPEPVASLVKGTLDLLVLRTLELEPLHGAAIAERIFQTTRGTFHVKAGSLFPALHRLEQNGLIEGEWEMPPKGRRIKSYRLTREGRRRLSAEKASWQRVVMAMTLVLEGA